jgi:hypothetical protein
MDATGQQQTRLNEITKLAMPKVEKEDVSKKKERTTGAGRRLDKYASADTSQKARPWTDRTHTTV